MRQFEKSINNYMKAKILNVKEDLLSNQTHVRRLLKLMVEIDPNHNQSSSADVAGNWKLRIEGRIFDGREETEVLSQENSTTHMRFMDLF